MITVNLSEGEILRVLNFITPVLDRWPDEHELENARRKLDDALLAHDECVAAVAAKLAQS